MIHICVPVLKRYDLLREMIKSCMASNRRPDAYYIIDNGQNGHKLMSAIHDLDIYAKIHTPKIRPYGIAESWNWFIKHVPEERIITNDDIIFGPNSIELLLASTTELVRSEFGFACFVIRNSCVEKLGYFDEAISPGYGYYEDEDYLQRLDGRGTREPSARSEEVQCGAHHHHSATIQAMSHPELLEHHRKFLIAQRNYAEKWGLQEAFGLSKSVAS